MIHDLHRLAPVATDCCWKRMSINTAPDGDDSAFVRCAHHELDEPIMIQVSKVDRLTVLLTVITIAHEQSDFAN